MTANISDVSTMLVSSMTIRSQSSGCSASRRKPPVFGSVSSSRWMVFASIPVCSVIRLAAQRRAPGVAPKKFVGRIANQSLFVVGVIKICC